GDGAFVERGVRVGIARGQRVGAHVAAQALVVVGEPDIGAVGGASGGCGGPGRGERADHQGEREPRDELSKHGASWDGERGSIGQPVRNRNSAGPAQGTRSVAASVSLPPTATG